MLCAEKPRNNIGDGYLTGFGPGSFLRISYPTNGRDFDQEEACKALIPGEKYQLQNAFVGRSNTRVLLRNITGYFNSVMFDFVDGNGKPVNIYEMPQFRMY